MSSPASAPTSSPSWIFKNETVHEIRMVSRENSGSYGATGMPKNVRTVPAERCDQAGQILSIVVECVAGLGLVREAMASTIIKDDIILLLH